MSEATVLWPEAATWRPARPGALCRASASRWSPGCKAPAVVEMNRGRHNYRNFTSHDLWWGYCSEHSVGRVVLDGVVYAAVGLPEAVVAARVERWGPLRKPRSQHRRRSVTLPAATT